MPITVITRLTTAIIQPTGITPITIVITLTILTIITTITTVIIGIGITIGISVAARRRAGSPPSEHFNFRPRDFFALFWIVVRLNEQGTMS